MPAETLKVARSPGPRVGESYASAERWYSQFAAGRPLARHPATGEPAWRLAPRVHGRPATIHPGIDDNDSTPPDPVMHARFPRWLRDFVLRWQRCRFNFR